MQVFGKDIIEELSRRHPKARKSLEAWLEVMEANSFRHFADLKRVVRSADYVKPHTVFNISKNKYRLIAQISYAIQAVRVASIVTHEEYGRGRWRSKV